ncbi:uncharacterized mitochondrial protein AtMg00820-like [Lactuca sativa]|uniref:uncharacterized mitochondrial protein AtMg00820-like n=1 Tax=Lactuca sativa TaxID=4236 RepID=UPI0022AFB471|nr:uncharacterized mitochondrial protein AtMg00820-like [Lactuca sativa]
MRSSSSMMSTNTLPPPASSSCSPPTTTVSPRLSTSYSTRTHSMVICAKRSIHKPVDRLNLHVDTISSSIIPRNYYQAFQHPNWLNAMKDEYGALISNSTRVLVPQPSNANVVNCIWFFKMKLNADGSLARYKVLLVANGYCQHPIIGCDETFSLFIKLTTI